MSVLFFGAGAGPATFDVYFALETAAGVEAALSVIEPWAASGRRAVVRREGTVISVHVAFAKRPNLEAGLRATVDRIGKRAPLALVVRTNRVTMNARSRAVIAEPGRVLDVLEKVLSASTEPYRALTKSIGGADSIHEGLFEALAEGSVLGGFVQRTLARMTESMRSPEERAVWHDLLLTRLPDLAGRHFAVDAAIQQRLALTRGVSPTMIELSARYREVVSEMMTTHHREQHAFRDERTADSGVDWTKVDSVRRRLESKSRDTLHDVVKGFSDTNPAHTKTLLALTSSERVELAAHRPMSTLMCNAAVSVMAQGKFADALTIYDSALTAPIDSGAAANPLYAVQDDNNHLGIDAERSRRYLERCLPHGPRNPTIFLNAAFVAAELGDHDEAVRLLREAKAHGIKVARYSNEGLFVPLRERADFKKVMK